MPSMKEFSNKCIAKYHKDYKTRTIKQTDLYLYRNIDVPGVLIECGFLSNANDRYLLQQKYYQQRFSKLISLALVKYINNSENVYCTIMI